MSTANNNVELQSSETERLQTRCKKLKKKLRSRDVYVKQLEFKLNQRESFGQNNETSLTHHIIDNEALISEFSRLSLDNNQNEHVNETLTDGLNMCILPIERIIPERKSAASQRDAVQLNEGKIMDDTNRYLYIFYYEDDY